MTTILIVEDDALIALDMQSILENAGFEVMGPVGSPEEAIAQINACPPEAALLDGRLRNDTSDSVATKLAAHGIPFAFVTGRSTQELPQTFQSVPLITKPFAAHDLLAITHGLVKTSAAA
jgi:DNA-binding response OmpR family regulator